MHKFINGKYVPVEEAPAQDVVSEVVSDDAAQEEVPVGNVENPAINAPAGAELTALPDVSATPAEDAPALPTTADAIADHDGDANNMISEGAPVTASAEEAPAEEAPAEEAPAEEAATATNKKTRNKR